MPIPRPEGPLSQLLSQLASVWDYIDAQLGGGGGPGSTLWTDLDFTGSSLAHILTRSASDLSSGTLPDARFPATLPALSGTNLTNLNASNLASGTVAAARMPALTGDVTSTVGTVATTIANNAVSLAKLADIATGSFLGRNTAATGDPEVLSIATAKTMLGLGGTNTGDVTLAGENYLSLAGQVLTANAVNLGNTNVAGTLTVNKGGTGLVSYAVGDLLYASASTTLAKLAGVATGNALISGGVSTAPSWGKIGLATHVSGTLPVANGGTGATSFTSNGVLYGNSAGAIQATAQGAANTVLIANAGAPSFSASPVIGTSVTVPLITTLSSGNLTIAPTGSVTFDPTGNQIDPLTNYDLNLGQLSKKYLTLHAAELWVETLVAQDTAATIGGRVLIGPTTVLTSDLPAAATSIVVKHNQMVNGDRVYLESGGKVEFLAITSAPSGTGPYTYTVTRNLDGTGANDWFAGDAVFNTGQTGNGFIDLYSIRGVKTSSQVGPTIVGNVRNSSTYNDWSERWAIGNLNGLYGYGTDIYGVALGVPTAAWVKIDPTNGVRIGHNTTTLTQIDAAGNASFTGTITASAGSIGGWTVSSNRISSGTTHLASGFDIPAGAVSWFGKSATGYHGWRLSDGSKAIEALVGNLSVYPYLYIYDGTRFRVVLGGLNFAWGSDGSTDSMGMKIWNSAGTKLVEFSDVQNIISGWAIGATKISSTGIDIHSGANAGLAFGTTPPTSASSGTGMWIDRTGWYGLASSVVQAKMDTATGRIVAGAGSLWLDASGLNLDRGIGTPNQIKWWNSNATPFVAGYMYATDAAWVLAVQDATPTYTAIVALTHTAAKAQNKNMFGIGSGQIVAGYLDGVSGYDSVEPKAQLILNSTSSGFLPNRLTTTQRDAISTPPNGLVLFNTTTQKLQVRASGAWADLH